MEASIQIERFCFNPFQVNSYILYDDSLSCLIIDASCYSEAEFIIMNNFIAKNGLKPEGLINTHGHVDHLTGTARICAKYSIEFSMHQSDQFLLKDAWKYGAVFGFDIELPPVPGKWLTDGEKILFGNSYVQAFHCPGHSPGSLVFYSEKNSFLITGDVLFAGSIGRTDLPGGNYEELMSSITKRILILPLDTRIYPGHGPDTTIEVELKNNPFLKGSY